MSTTIEQLELEVSSNSTSAASGLDELSLSLRRLREAVAPISKGGMGLGALSTSLSKFSQSMSSLSGLSIARKEIKGLADAMKPLEGIQKSGFNSMASGLEKLAKVAPGIDGITESLKNADLDAFAVECDKVAVAIKPLATEMEKVAAGFSSFPSKIQKLLSTNTNWASSNNRVSNTYVNLAAKIALAVTAVKRFAKVVAGWITESNEYVENLNLFTVAMGEFAGEAQAYAETVGDIMGIDPGEWMRNQGVFMTLATGFGVVNDRAYIMSQNLTQLGYDLSSFFNISYAESMQKLQSGISGELEPLRRLGYDLSNARLQQEALNLGIKKKVTAMTQAEKAELRYYTIMRQVTVAQGDMSRTLEAPANQLRILKSQVEQAARSLGNIFIPILNAVLPYAIAAAKVIRLVANSIANLLGFTLPEIDYSGVNSAAGGANDLADGLDDAAKKAKEVKNALLGIDELNIISPPDASAGDTDDLGVGGFNFDLPTYDFIGDAVTGRVAEIVEEMKKWLGITEEVDTWGELFHTKLGRILTTVGAIGVGIATWKLSGALIDGLSKIMTLREKGLGKAATFSAGVALAITGITLEASGIADAIQTELNELNFTQILGGGSLLIGGGALIGKVFSKAFIGGAVGGIVAGIPAFITGVYDSITNGISWLSAALTAVGATAAGAGIGAIIGSLGGPIGTLAGALIGLIVGVVTDLVILIVQKWDEIVEWWNTTVVPFFANIPIAVSNVVEAVANWFSELPGKIAYWLGFAVGAVVKWVQDTDEKLREKIPEIISNVVEWFKGLPGRIGDAISLAVNKVVTWASDMIAKVKEEVPRIIDKFVSFFKEIPGKLYDLGVDIWNGFIDGLRDTWHTVVGAISDFVGNFIDGFREGLDINSPSRVFRELGEFTVMGFNLGISDEGKSTRGVVNKWIDSFTSSNPTMSFGVDTSALRYYNSDSFAKSVSANVTSSSSVTATGFMEGMEEFYREYIEPTMSQMATDMRRQADKDERPVVQIGNRVVSEAVTIQQRANGYAFAR